MNQKQRLMEHLHLNKTINPLQAWRSLGIYRLSAQVHILRKEGWNIETKDFKVNNQFGEKCVVAEYVLNS